MKHSRQRDAIMEYLMSVKCHPTADEVYENVRKVIPNVSLGTVYRNLAQLSEAGSVRKLKVGTMDRFDGDVSPHAHFVCKVCGKVTDVALPASVIPLPNGFLVDSAETFVYGTCANCNKMN